MSFQLHSENKPYAQSRQIGEAVVTLINEATFPWAPDLQVPQDQWRRAMPEADAEGAVLLSCQMACIQIRDAMILVDPGFEEPSSPWERQRSAEWNALERTPGLHAWLAAVDVPPERITHVLITHTHGDHFDGVASADAKGQYTPRFPRARHWMGRRDWEANPDRSQPHSSLTLRLGAVERAGLLNLIDAEREIAPGVSLIPAPGETPGHCIVRLQSGSACFYYLGDLYHHHCEVQHPDWVSAGRDPSAMIASRQRLCAAAVQEDATLVFTHHPFPGWGKIRPTSTGYVWES